LTLPGTGQTPVPQPGQGGGHRTGGVVQHGDQRFVFHRSTILEAIPAR
jgi:hypothetical protein